MGTFSFAYKRFFAKAAHLVCVVRYKFGMPLSISALKCLGSDFAVRQSSGDYVKLLMCYDETFKVPDSYIFDRFVGFNGVGEGTLNSFRILRSPNGFVFEKIYLTSSQDFIKFAHFLDHHQCAFGEGAVSVPLVMARAEGEKIAAVYFQYVDVRKVDTGQYLRMARACMESLCQYPVEAELDDLLCDIYAHTGFSRCYRKTKGFLFGLSGEDAWLDKALLRVSAMPRFYAHGDLSIKNMSAAGYVFDWDNSGYYPPGFDLALVLLISGLGGHPTVAAAAADYHSLVKQRCSFDDFYFSLLFLYTVLKGNRDVLAKTSLLDELKSLL